VTATGEPTDYVMFINGSYGVGKSSVLDHVGDLLAAAGRPFALMDVDWFHRSWPPADNEPDNVLTEAANMAAAWSNYRRPGPRQLVVGGVIAAATDRERLERALGLVVRSVRLEADPDVTSSRLRSRYPERAAALAWHLDRYQQLARRLAAADSDELVIATDDLTPRAVAERVLHHFDSPPGGTGRQPPGRCG